MLLLYRIGMIQSLVFFFFQAEDGIRDGHVTGVQTCALRISGRGYCSREAVEMLVKEGALCIKDLIEMGMQFDQSEQGFNLGLEGGHSARRILHANGAATGKALIDFLLPVVMSHPGIKIIEYGLVYQLLCRDQACGGADLYSLREQQNIRVLASATILAT